jgi:hypothetical protein
MTMTSILGITTLVSPAQEAEALLDGALAAADAHDRATRLLEGSWPADYNPRYAALHVDWSTKLKESAWRMAEARRMLAMATMGACQVFEELARWQDTGREPAGDEPFPLPAVVASEQAEASRHGKYSTYAHGCRCDLCRDAMRAYAKARKARQSA